VRLTPKGFEQFRRAAILHMQSITDRMGNALDDDELQQLIGLCDKLRRSQEERTARARSNAPTVE
jgi:hypothetical protein